MELFGGLTPRPERGFTPDAYPGVFAWYGIPTGLGGTAYSYDMAVDADDADAEYASRKAAPPTHILQNFSQMPPPFFVLHRRLCAVMLAERACCSSVAVPMSSSAVTAGIRRSSAKR